MKAASRLPALIERRAPYHPDVHCLRDLLALVAGDNCWRKRLMNL